MTRDEFGLLGNSDLQAFNQQIQAANPFGLAGRSVAASQMDMSTWSPTQQGVGSFAKSFLAGLLNSYAQKQSADQLNSVVQVLPQLRSDPMSVATPEGVSEDAFATIRGTAAIKKAERQQFQSQGLAEMMQKVGIEGLIEKEKILQKNAAFKELAGAGIESPDDPNYKVNQDLLKLKQDNIGTERTLANDFLKVGQDFKDKEKGVTALVQAFKDPSGSSDYELIRRAAQSVEPGLAVRTDDISSIQGAASVLGLSTAAISAAISGESKLSPRVRAGIMRIAKRGYDSSLTDYNTLRSSFLERSKAAQLNPDFVVPFGAGVPFDQAYPDLDISLGLTPQIQGGMVEVTNPRTKKTFMVPEGDPLLQQLGLR